MLWRALRAAAQHRRRQAPVAPTRASGLSEGQPLLLTSKSDISIKDIGVLSVRPGAAEGDGRALFAAEEALHHELSRHGLVSLEEARSAAAAREGAEQRGAEAHAILTSVEPTCGQYFCPYGVAGCEPSR